jgi:LytS/YehU family sensor histidine kinase
LLAYDYQKKAFELNDSLKNADLTQKVSDLQKSYEINKKENEITLLKAEQEKLAFDLKLKNLITIFLSVIIITIIVLLVVIVYSYMRKQRLAAALDNQNKEIQRLNSMLEIRALRSQMDPHFVFNALNGLQHFLKVNSAEASIEYLSRLARLIRLTLQNASRDWVKLSEEVEILKLYLEVERYRFPGKFEFEFSIDKSVANEKVPFLVIQPSVENAVLHGLIPRKENGGKLLIKAERIDDTLQITVQDNGVGRTETKKHTDPEYVSMSSGLVRDRLKKLSLQLNMMMDITIEDLKDENGIPSGTKSILTFELQPKEISLTA